MEAAKAAAKAHEEYQLRQQKKREELEEMKGEGKFLVHAHHGHSVCIGGRHRCSDSSFETVVIDAILADW